MSEWGKMTVAQLKAELTKRGLEKTGTKADLVSRLADSDVDLADNAVTEVVEEEKVEEEKEEEEVVKEVVKEELEDNIAAATPLDAEEEAVEESEQDVEHAEAEPEPEPEPEPEQVDVNMVKEEQEADQAEEEPESDDIVHEQPVDTTDIHMDESKLDKSTQEEETNDLEKMETDEKVTAEKDVDEEKSEKKGKKGPKKWVAIMENEKTSKVVDELSKINKLDSLKARAKEIFLAHESHKVRVFPLVPEDLNDPLIIEVIKRGVSSMVKFTSSDPDLDPKGMLEVTFARRAVLDEYSPKLALFKESVNVIVDKKEHEWKDQYRQATDLPENAADLEKLRLFAPSLPQSVEEADMWEYFPKAREMLLIDAKPRKHAYITFSSEESMIQSVEELNNRGPQKDDFKFCRLLRLANVIRLIPRRTGGDMRGPRTPRRGPVNMNRAGPRTPRTVPRAPRVGPRTPREASPKAKASSNGRPQRPAKLVGRSPRQSAPASGQRSRDIQGRREALNRRRDDHGDRRSSYWGAAPRQRGAGLQSSFSQLQQPVPLAHPQAQQGLQVLDTLLSTLGQMGTTQQSDSMARQSDRRGNDGRSRNESFSGQKRGRSPQAGRNKRRRRGPLPSPHQSAGDSRRESYGQRSSDMGSGSVSYSRSDEYRHSGHSGDRIYNAIDAVSKIARLRESLSHSEQRPDHYGAGGSGYRQDSYY